MLFAKHSLLSDPPFSQIDLIVCRNLLIYLDREVQRKSCRCSILPCGRAVSCFSGPPNARMPATNCLPRWTNATGSSAPRPAPPTAAAPRPCPAAATCEPISRQPPQNAVQRKIVLRRYPSARPGTDRATEHDCRCQRRHPAHERRRRAFPAACGGELTRNLLALVLPELRLEIRTTLFQVQQSGLPVNSREVRSSASSGAT